MNKLRRKPTEADPLARRGKAYQQAIIQAQIRGEQVPYHWEMNDKQRAKKKRDSKV